jgi:hypothetical protein
MPMMMMCVRPWMSLESNKLGGRGLVIFTLGLILVSTNFRTFNRNLQASSIGPLYLRYRMENHEEWDNTLAKDDVDSLTTHALLFRQQQLEKWPHQPQLHGQTFIATPAYNLGGPGGNMSYAEYLANSRKEARTERQVADMVNIWNNWTATMKQSQAYSERPNRTVVKVLLMTKDEGPLVKQWVLYHGELLGFENLYILDGSHDAEDVAFMKYAHDQLGVNVIFTPSNLEELPGDMNLVFGQLSKAADVLIKMDTDEFLALDTGNATCSNVKPLSDAAAGLEGERSQQNDCRLSPYGLSEYLQSSSDLHGQLDGRLMRIAWTSNSLMMSQLKCNDGKADDLGSFSFANTDADAYKQVHDSRTFGKSNLGGHLVPNDSISPWGNDITNSPFGVIHFHFRCRDIEAANSRKAMVGHGYIDETDTPEMVLAKFKAQVPALADDVCVAEFHHFPVSSGHKIVQYLKYLAGCDDGNVGESQGPKNPEFAQFLQQTLARYMPLSIETLAL